MVMNGHPDDSVNESEFKTGSAYPHPLIVGFLIATVGFVAGLVIDALILGLMAVLTVVFKMHPDYYWVTVLLLVVLTLTTFGPLFLCFVGFPEN